jgi:hypothetical protein
MWALPLSLSRCRMSTMKLLASMEKDEFVRRAHAMPSIGEKYCFC